MELEAKRGGGRWRRVLYRVIFESDTPGGKWFDLLLIVSILLSVTVVMLASVWAEDEAVGPAEVWLGRAEWFFTILFTVEYVLRLVSVQRPGRYALSFFGVVDLLAILPTYLNLILPGARYLLTVRILRVLRIFRILKLGEYLTEADQLRDALWESRRKILIFLMTVLTLVVILGSVLYTIEGKESGFTNIPTSVYWAIVTLTTVGYGDISPQTAAGQFIASIIMILGYAIIAVPTGIVSVEAARGRDRGRTCEACGRGGHDADAVHCKWCGARLG